MVIEELLDVVSKLAHEALDIYYEGEMMEVRDAIVYIREIAQLVDK